jgi:hypothetical protein
VLCYWRVPRKPTCPATAQRCGSSARWLVVTFCVLCQMGALTRDSSAKLTPRRRGPPAQHAMLALRIVRGPGRAACRGRHSLYRGGTARSTRVLVEFRDVLRKGAQSAQGGSEGMRALARRVEVGLDRAGAVSNLQPSVSVSCERGGDTRLEHCPVCDSGWCCAFLKTFLTGIIAFAHEAEPSKLRPRHQLSCWHEGERMTAYRSRHRSCQRS